VPATEGDLVPARSTTFFLIFSGKSWARARSLYFSTTPLDRGPRYTVVGVGVFLCPVGEVRLQRLPVIRVHHNGPSDLARQVPVAGDGLITPGSTPRRRFDLWSLTDRPQWGGFFPSRKPEGMESVYPSRCRRRRSAVRFLAAAADAFVARATRSAFVMVSRLRLPPIFPPLRPSTRITSEMSFLLNVMGIS
jgi:hypothetical protein